MKLVDWLGIVQTICVVGAFAGLILQLRQSERTSRAAAYNDLIAQLGPIHDHLYGSEDADALKEALAPDLDITPRQMVFALSLLNLLESVHYQYRLGVIPSELWRGWEQQIGAFMKMPFFREFWKQNRNAYNERFRSIADRAAAIEWRSTTRPEAL